MLDLLSYIICHRFSSPSWVRHLSGHISTHIPTTTGSQSWANAVVDLETGEALLFSPPITVIFPTPVVDSLQAAIPCARQKASWCRNVYLWPWPNRLPPPLLFSLNALCTDGNGQLFKLGNGHIHLFTRPRIIRDGRQSILAVGAIDDSSDRLLLGILPGVYCG